MNKSCIFMFTFVNNTWGTENLKFLSSLFFHFISNRSRKVNKPSKQFLHLLICYELIQRDTIIMFCISVNVYFTQMHENDSHTRTHT